MRPLRILILSDGRPGHYHLAEGVAAAIKRRRPVAVEKREIARRRAVPGRVLAWMLAGRVSPSLVLKVGYGVNLERGTQYDVVISAGGDTLAANVAAARLTATANIFCGTLRRVPPEAMSLVISSYARHAARPRHLVALKPSGIDPDTLSPATKSIRTSGRLPVTAGLLIGGNSGFFTYRADEWARLIEFINASYCETGTRWIVSTSRRSPDIVADHIAKLASRADSPIAEFIDFRTAGAGTLPRLFAQVEAILCTEDSSTMISEAVCARLPVIGVSPAQHGFKDEEREYRSFMEREGWCRFIGLAELTPSTFGEALRSVKPLKENHLDRLADQLRERLPKLFE